MTRRKTLGVKDAPPSNILKFDAKKRAAYLEQLQSGGRRYASARAIGISPATVVNHRKADPEFDDQCNEAEKEADDEVEDALRMAAISGNVTAALAWLYSRRSERWSDTRKVEVKHTWQSEIAGLLKEGRITLDDVEANLPPELYREFIESSGAIVVQSGSGAGEDQASRRKVDPKS